MSFAKSPTVQGALSSLAAFAIFSTHDVVVKFLGADFSSFQIVFFSVLFGFPVVTVMLMRDRTDGNLRPRYPLWTGLRTVAQVTTSVCVFYAFSALPMAQTYAILFATPLLITLLAIPMLGEKVGWQRGAAVLAGLAGVMVVLQPGSTQLTLGHAAALVGAFSGSFAAVIMRKVGRDERNAVLMLYPMVANFLVMGAVLPFVYQPVHVQHLGGFFMMAVLGFSATLLQILAYRTASAVTVAPMQYSQIIWAALYGYLFFSENVDWNTVLGAAIIIASGVFIVLREDSKPGSGAPVLSTRGRYVQGTLPRLGSMARLVKRSRIPAE
ncbi:DMT family transporter [Mangrovicoccus algicola]|uniref:DMT family transporter n=1 Tax=Mangrovicoccus algicola TaxID=2771008 RepID=A0A8J7D0A3_9RHOB|nr:DMT family transporter [Mangrovicoccus algicola]MBE3639178.1 DMT family transporter [Mangrovicoccus algicola]